MENKYLIALGASAGGLAALSEFFDNTLPDAVSYVITTHLYPHEKSILNALIQKHTSIEVREAEDDMTIQPNIIYVMPENKVMSIEDGRLRLAKRDLSIKVNMAIDIFFNSLSEDTIFKKIAIILTGLGNDGTRGVQKIAKNGGYVIAQRPDLAYQGSMPRSVITSGFADLVLPIKEMPQAIIDYVETKKTQAH